MVIVKISLTDILKERFLLFFPSESSIFLKAGSKTLQKSSIEQNISVILSVQIIAERLVKYLVFNTLNILVFLLLLKYY